MAPRNEPRSPVGGIAIMALIASAIMIAEAPLSGSRPGSSGIDFNEFRPDENVQARLWQDPFEVVQNHLKKNHKQKNMEVLQGRGVFTALPMVSKDEKLFNIELATSLQKNNDGDCIVNLEKIEGETHHSLGCLADKVKEHLKPEENVNKILTVLGVMVFGSPYAEDHERRIRYRYAVLSALGVLDYAPVESEFIGYVESESTSLEDSLPKIIPYEWLLEIPKKGSKHKQEVLLLWLNGDSFKKNPWQKIEGLKKKLSIETTEENKSELKFKIIGPASSPNLKQMIEDLNKKQTKKSLENHETNSNTGKINWNYLKNVKIFSTNATAKLDPAVNNNNRPKIFRTIKDDYELMVTLIDELKLRGVKIFDDEEKHHIAVISEWDTFYGRSLPKNFADAFSNNSKDMTSRIHKFKYLRGLDGKTNEKQGFDSQKVKNDKKSEKQKNASEITSIARPVGSNQLDYLRRLASKIKKLDQKLRDNGKDKIKAIGVLGSDVYDKLLILQALRDRFPTAIFFTTDLDARFLHPDEYKWTRNLVVASTFGLTLNLSSKEKSIPPFRDSYQTSRFFGTLLAMSDTNNLTQKDIYSILKPRIFEIGRNKAFDLSKTQGAKLGEFKDSEEKNIFNALLKENIFEEDKIYAQTHSQFINNDKVKFKIVLCFILLFIALFFLTNLFIKARNDTSAINYGLTIIISIFVLTAGESVKHCDAFKQLIAAKLDISYILLSSLLAKSQVIFIVIMIAALLVTHYLKIFREIWNELVKLVKNEIAILVIGAYFLILLFWSASYWVNNDIAFCENCEPWSLLGGVSLWPAEIIRLLAGALSVVFITKILSELNNNDAKMKEMFFSVSSSSEPEKQI
ncbi:MAG: hypothetical protein CMD96_06190 [Gammaproteobacteria bacterium]|nr:hypothetical protein [Gammaproteobacteria bacterium]HJP17921.1 hypothetical protein [Nitrospinota bacterium]